MRIAQWIRSVCLLQPPQGRSSFQQKVFEVGRCCRAQCLASFSFLSNLVSTIVSAVVKGDVSEKFQLACLDAPRLLAHNRAHHTHLFRIPIWPTCPTRPRACDAGLSVARPKISSSYRSRAPRKLNPTAESSKNESPPRGCAARAAGAATPHSLRSPALPLRRVSADPRSWECRSCRRGSRARHLHRVLLPILA